MPKAIVATMIGVSPDFHLLCLALRSLNRFTERHSVTLLQSNVCMVDFGLDLHALQLSLDILTILLAEAVDDARRHSWKALDELGDVLHHVPLGLWQHLELQVGPVHRREEHASVPNQVKANKYLPF